MKFLYVSKKVDDSIEVLKQTGKTGKNLADKATSVIDGLASGTAEHLEEIQGTFTKHGEKRIKNCQKYDLGCGYRLITVQRGETIFIPFLGTHDSCHRWLETNSRLKEFVGCAGRKISIHTEKRVNLSSREGACEDPVGDDDFFSHLTDKDLRVVFSGLVQGSKRQ